tara:strand:+ start:2384 stop:3436 length:1053 start_codon:yes stop_codon:yes gene_type:complete
MAKSDLLKEAIADAKAVKETALANAKIALQEAFQPRIKSMLENELMNELEDEDMVDGEEVEMGMDDMDDMDMDSDMADETPDMVGVAVDLDNDGDYDLEGEIGMDDEEDMDDMLPAETDDVSPEMEMTDDMADDMNDDDMDLEEIIRELEEDLDSDAAAAGIDEKDVEEGMYEGMYEEEDVEEGMYESNNSIEELIEAILAEEEEEEEEEVIGEMAHAKDEAKDEEMKEELEEAYKTVSHLKSVINEVNLLNAKLLYTNKLFRNFELSESQKMKVIENFDRAANTREAKLVFSTLAESFQTRKAGKKIVKESKSMASRPVATTAPSKQTTQVLTEGFEQANRWKKLAGLK